jgi:hypothetical protein
MLKKLFFITLVGAAAVAALGGISSATALGPASLPPNWHIHDGQTSLGGQHKGAGFFPTILGVSRATYLASPDLWARCPNATDKAFLPSAETSQAPQLRDGVCMNATDLIHLRTVPVGTSGPAGWSSLTAASEPGWVTYYLVTPT